MNNVKQNLERGADPATKRIIGFRVSPSQRLELEDAAALLELSLSAFVRQAALAKAHEVQDRTRRERNG